MRRRDFLAGSCAGLLATLPQTRLALAHAATDRRLVVVVLRGGMDGLAALAPWADPGLRRLRPRLAPGRAGVIDLDGYFGLDAGLGGLMPLWQAGELAFLPAATTRYRERSHAEGQALLENGTASPEGARDGWLNRALLALNDGDARLGLSLGPAVPLILQGAATVQSWSNDGLPEPGADFLTRLGLIYRHDAAFAAAFEAARGSTRPDPALLAGIDDTLFLGARVAGSLLAQTQGPRVAVIEMQGWDTHINQGARLAGQFGRLTEALLTLRAALGSAWEQSAVLVVSEFGRTAAENGAGGTDHGTGGLAMVLGGALGGGRLLGDWPGLSTGALYEGRDLAAPNALESLFKAALIGHMGLAPAQVDESVFPASAHLAPLPGLFGI